MSLVQAPPLARITPAGRELELKFLVNDSGFKASRNWPALAQSPPKRAVRLRSVYFDTEQGDLHRRGLSLRLRGQRRGYMMTLKYPGGLPGGLFERGEAEVFCGTATPDPALLGPQFAAAIAEAAGGLALQAVYATDIRRVTHLLRLRDSAIEIAFDSGFVQAGERKTAIREIELELKSGDPADLFRLGIQLAENFPVRLGTLSKAARGFHLSRQTLPQVARGTAPLTGAPAVDEAISASIGGCLKQFTGNFAAFESGDAGNAIHQMRVALRRLRALLGLFQRGFACAEFLGFRDEAKRIAAAMGEARNFDVFLALLRDGPAAAFPAEPDLATMQAECEARRAAGHEAVRAVLADPATTAFILRLQAFVARGGWRNGLSAEALTRLTAPAKDFAAAQLLRQHGKLLKQGKHLHALTAHQRHELRISLKKLRYAADGFGGLFDNGKQMRAYAKAAAKLQDALGGSNDLVVAGEIVGQLETAGTRAAGIVLGWCAHAGRDGDGLSDCWKVFRKTKPF